MSSPHRPLDPHSGFVFDTHELGRVAGGMKRVTRTVEAPADLGIEVIAVPPGSPIELDLMLEAVVEGVLVTGSATAQLHGTCVRCLAGIDDEIEVDLQELYVHPGSEAGEDDVGRLEGDLIDLEPLLRDAVVLDLPFQPLCRNECRGLCADCGADLNADPDHGHDAPVDPRWAKLSAFE
jgi:DUF177 domain-containing protein